MIGKSCAFLKMMALIEKITLYDAPVLIEGETGTGKELAARAIHYQGKRRHGPFVPLNCGALPDNLIESELFGHCRGAFTDARTDKPGVVELAHAGTLFLDEVDALSGKAQVALLRFLQDQQFRPVGGRTERSSDVRIIAATNRRLSELEAQGQFRLDLFYRLRILHLRLPPLREREGDPELLARHFAQIGSARFGKCVRPFDPQTLHWFSCYHWPGNIRELENMVYQGLLLGDGPCIQLNTPAGLQAPEPAGSSMNYRCAKERAIVEFESRFLRAAMHHSGGNVSAAARLIGTERRHLGRLLKKYQIEA
ncbi:sigma-54 interaction domain-containing protein [Dyella flagellata]|uniref:Sigma-54 factor interaction domain-containing protein n=1 Tax=Dyella flagellata TaxID=1867833 RepID=A0ABQ5XDY9_9GAMM|nr:sigma-54 dependent transcriptional regulator [Dyella flagellata]GLQ89906.1 hypothetical protein GCM10007898_34810 [Dyella flagellata]